MGEIRELAGGYGGVETDDTIVGGMYPEQGTGFLAESFLVL